MVEVTRDELALVVVSRLHALHLAALRLHWDADDGYRKTADGQLRVELPAAPFLGEPPHERPVVSIYSYSLGPSRMHTFGGETLADAAVAACRAVAAWLASRSEEDDLGATYSARMRSLSRDALALAASLPDAGPAHESRDGSAGGLTLAVVVADDRA